MYRMHIVLEGLTDFLFNKMTDADLDKFKKGESGGTATDAQRRKAAESKIYLDDAGAYLPAWTVKRVMLDGARAGGFKVARKALHYILAPAVFIQDLPRFKRNGKPITGMDYLHEIPGRMPPKKGAATIVRRPALRPGWQLVIELVCLNDDLPPDRIQVAFEAAGLNVGMGSWRPEFGRFIVKQCDRLKS